MTTISRTVPHAGPTPERTDAGRRSEEQFRSMAPSNRPPEKIRRELENNPEAAPDDIFATLIQRE
jgi:hypothetical protein